MPIHDLALSDGTIVKLNSDMTFGSIKKFQKLGLLSDNFLTKLASFENNIKDADLSDIDNAPYMCYSNNYKQPHLSQEEFNDLLPYDIEFSAKLFSEMVSGSNKKGNLQKEFKEKTTKSPNKKKSNYQNQKNKSKT